MRLRILGQRAGARSRRSPLRWESSPFDSVELLEEFLSSGRDANPRQSAMHPLLLAEDPEMLELLLVAGSDPALCVANANGCSLQIVSRSMSRAISSVQVLLCYGALPQMAARSDLGGTSYQTKAVGESHGRYLVEVFESALQADASVEVIAGAFWGSLGCGRRSEALREVLELEGVIDDDAKRVCHDELGMHFGSLGELVRFLNEPDAT